VLNVTCMGTHVDRAGRERARRPRGTPDPDIEASAPAADPFIRRVATTVLLVAAGGLLVAVVVLTVEVFLVAFAGVLLAVFLRAFTDLIARHSPLSEGWALALVLIAAISVLGTGAWVLAPRLSEQAEEMTERLPVAVAELESWVQGQPWGPWIIGQIEEGGMPESVGPLLGDAVAGGALWFTYFLTFLFVGLFGAANPNLYKDGLVRLFPIRKRARAREVIGELSYTLRWWLIGRAVAMLMVGATTAVVLSVLGMPVPLLLGTVAGLLTFVPYLGPIAAGVPIVIFALLESPQLAVYVLVAYTGIQVFEGYVLDPLIMQKLVYIPPVLTLVMQVGMAVLVGVIGIAMATPLAAVLLVLVRKVYREDVLGDRSGGEAGR
jgi:predicted PurR-regulated permease PerM